MLIPGWDPSGPPWPAVLGKQMATQECDFPIFSPLEQDQLRDQTLAQLVEHNVTAFLMGSAGRVAEWRALLPNQTIPAWEFNLVNRANFTPERMVDAWKAGEMRLFGEITNQYHGILPDDPRMEPYWAAAEEHDIPVALHMGMGPPGVRYTFAEEYRAAHHSPLLLEPVLRAHPRLRIFVMHAGWPMADEMIALMWNHPQVYVDTGCIVFCVKKEAFYSHLERLVDAGMGERIMFGSDAMTWPDTIGYGIRVIEEAPFLDETQKRDILYNNAKRFFRMPD